MTDHNRLAAYAELPDDKLWRLVGAVAVSRSPEGPSAVLEAAGESELAEEGLFPRPKDVKDLATRGRDATVEFALRAKAVIADAVCPSYEELRDKGIIDIARPIADAITRSKFGEDWGDYVDLIAVALARLGLDHFCA